MVRILVADDNPAMRRCLRGVLEQQDDWHVCDEVSNGAEAVHRFEIGRHDVIVLDFQMPEMNGLEAAREIVREWPQTPILMVTLYLTKQLALEAKRAGIRGACAKTDLTCLVNAVGALLRDETYFPN